MRTPGWPLLLLAASACAPRSPEAAYVGDRDARRAALVASLVNPANGYSQLRLARYAVAGGWEALPEWNPRAEPLDAAALTATTPPPPGSAPPALTQPLSSAAAPLPLDGSADDEPALRALGEAAFFRYPVQLLPATARLATLDDAAGYGLWRDDAHGVGGLVRAEAAGGQTVLAASCATCHAAPRDGALVIGLGNDRLDLGRLLFDAEPGAPADAPMLRWGAGRLDVSSSDGSEPVRIPDLRPTRWLGELQADATVRQRDLVTLAIRLETLIVTSHGEQVRPPRLVALALATYVWSLAAALPAPASPSPATAPAAARGAARFAAACSGCHAPPGLTGPPVPLAQIGTDPTLGRSPDRGTGFYRVPSLRGVRLRGLLLHDGALPSLAALFDPARGDDAFLGGVRPGPVPGHPFGLDLDPAARADLIAYLDTL